MKKFIQLVLVYCFLIQAVLAAEPTQSMSLPPSNEIANGDSVASQQGPLPPDSALTNKELSAATPLPPTTSMMSPPAPPVASAQPRAVQQVSIQQAPPAPPVQSLNQPPNTGNPQFAPPVQSLNQSPNTGNTQFAPPVQSLNQPPSVGNAQLMGQPSFAKAPPANQPPAAPGSINAGPPDAPTQSGMQSDAAQFQKWLQGSTTQQNLRPTMPHANQIPAPPLSAAVPPPSKVVVKRKYRVVKMKTGPDAPLVESPPLTYAEQKQIMQGMAPPLAIPPNPDSDIAFNAMMQQNMPLSPDQVIKLRQLIDTSQRAAAIPPTIPPKPVSTTLMINLAPGSTPPAIRLAQGYISSLVFVDSTGSPWPVAAYDLGDPKIVNVQWDGKSNVMMMQATSPYSSGNLVIRLAGLETPVTLELVSGQRVVDYRTDIRVPGIGPNAKDLPTGTGLPESANQLLLSVLDGVAPPGSKQLKIIGGDCQGWALNDKMYLRTRLTVLSPGWIGKMSSPDGMMAYELQLTSSVLVSQYGNPIELKIEGF